MRIWGKNFSGLNLLMHCDNSTTVDIVNVGKAKNSFAQSCLREIAFLSATYSLHVKVEWKPGVDNRLSDYLSRWSTLKVAKSKFFEEVGLSYDTTRLKQVLITDAHFKFLHDW